MSNKMKEEERKRLSGHIRKCLESQKDQEFILQIPLKRGASEREKKILPMEQIQYSVDLDDINLKVAEKEAENYGYEKPHKKSIKESLEENRKKIASGQKTSGVKKRRETTIE